MTAVPDELIDTAGQFDEKLDARSERPWVTLVWDDPVNLMDYVVHVLMSHFGYPKGKAQQLMLQVHNEGRCAVSSGDRESMERDVEAMHKYGLWATLAKDE